MRLKVLDSEKIYKVKFRKFSQTGFGDQIATNTDGDQILVNELLLRESELKKYSEYGGGYQMLEFVGFLPKSKHDSKSCKCDSVKEVKDKKEH